MAMDKLVYSNERAHEIVQYLSEAQDFPLKLGDRVTVFDNADREIKGTVRWLGANKDVNPDGSSIVGIETVKLPVICLWLILIWTSYESQVDS